VAQHGQWSSSSMGRAAGRGVCMPALLSAPVLLGWSTGRSCWLALMTYSLEASGPAFIKWGQVRWCCVLGLWWGHSLVTYDLQSGGFRACIHQVGAGALVMCVHAFCSRLGSHSEPHLCHTSWHTCRHTQ
jgi:hypothetical protein